MSLKCDFSEVSHLRIMYQTNLLEDYEYKGDMTSLFSNISSSFRILNVKKVNNPQLYGMYLLCKEELSQIDNSYSVNERMLYHATSPTIAKRIAEENINWRMTSRARYGIGACFSTSPEYAHKYSSSCGAFIICKVLTKKIENIGISYGLKVPNNENDTTLGNGQVFVKYDDYNFYPQFIVYYSVI